jgi:hypothetical protein
MTTTTADTNLSRFESYAAAFEQTYADDDWSRLAPYFHEDAVYIVRGVSAPCELHGRDRIFAGMRKSLDGFDRRMDERAIVPSAPLVADGDTVTLEGCVRYRRGDAPSSIDLRATIVATYAGGLIVRMEDTFHLDRPAITWLRAHAADLDGSYA